MSSAAEFRWEEMVPLDDLVVSGEVQLGRGNIISKIDIRNNPGPYPIYSSSSKNGGKMGEYGSFMFDEELISWSVDGGGYFFHRPKHKFSVTNVSGYMRLSPEWDYRFTAYSLQFQHEYFSFDYQTKAHPSVIREFYLFPKVPLPEQQKIAAILSSVDDVIEKTRAQIDKLKDLKTGMMQELLTKGIGSGGVPHTEFKDSPVGRIPRTWKYALLESVATIQTGIAKNGKAQGDMIEVPYLRVANVQDGYLDLSEIKSIRVERGRLERFSLKDEDVLVNEGGDFDKLGRGAIWDNQISPCVHQNHVFVVRTDKSCLLPKFFNYLSGSQYGKKYYLGCAKQTTNLASLNSSQLKAFPVLLPPVDEQAAICDLLDSMDKKITLSEKKKSAAEALKRALMQDLLTGKVRVNGCDNESAVA